VGKLQRRARQTSRFVDLRPQLMAKPESFLVTTSNTLDEGEAEHAATWAAGLAGCLVGSEADGR
jgi:hypothetical protein